MHSSLTKLLWQLLIALSLPLLAHGSDFQSPRSTALGGASHASPLPNDAVTLNPSGLSFTPVETLGLNYTPENILNLSFQNGSRDLWLQYGVAISHLESYSAVNVAVSKALIDEFSLGMGGKFIQPSNPGSASFLDASVSMTGIVSRTFRAAFIVDNLFDTGSAEGFNREFTLGTRFNLFSFIQLYLDPLWVPTLVSDESTWGYQMGAEIPFLEYFFIRAGAFRNAKIPYSPSSLPIRGDGFGAGLGLLLPSLAVDYALSRIIFPMSAISHHFGLTLYF